MTDDLRRRLSQNAFQEAFAVVEGVRKKRSVRINDKFFVMATCPACGHHHIEQGEVEYPIHGGYCVGCGRALGHLTVLSSARAKEIIERHPEISRPAPKPKRSEPEPDEPRVIALPIAGVFPDSEGTEPLSSLADALVAYLRSHPTALDEIVRMAEESRPEAADPPQPAPEEGDQ